MQSMYKDSLVGAINNLVKNIWSVYDLRPNFDMGELIGRFGGTIVPDIDNRLTDYEDAEIFEENNDGVLSFRIVYNHRLVCTEEEQRNLSNGELSNEVIDNHLKNALVRGAVAHEIGHLFLHMMKIKDGKLSIEGDYKRNIKDSSFIEWEAETFATIFQMPEQLFRIRYEGLELEYNDDFDKRIIKMAEIFGVPYNEIIKRGKQLKLWK